MGWQLIDMDIVKCCKNGIMFNHLHDKVIFHFEGVNIRHLK